VDLLAAVEVVLAAATAQVAATTVAGAAKEE
jgi:hypothetical protein